MNQSPVKKATTKTSTVDKKQVAGKICPKCDKGQLLKGSKAYGCSEYKNNCDFKIPFEIYGKKVSENQLIRLIGKNCTTNLKGFKVNGNSVEGLIRFDEDFKLKLETKKAVIAKEEGLKQAENSNKIASPKTRNDKNKIPCPKCKKGNILKGKTAYGCSDYKNGCNFVFKFDEIKKIAKGKSLTKELVIEIISN